MNGEDKFKKQLKDLLDSEEFTFDESDWKKASELIEASKTRKRVFLTLPVVLLLITGSVFYFYNAVNNNESAQLTSPQVQIQEQKADIVPSAEAAKVVTTEQDKSPNPEISAEKTAPTVINSPKKELAPQQSPVSEQPQKVASVNPVKEIVSKPVAPMSVILAEKAKPAGNNKTQEPLVETTIAQSSPPEISIDITKVTAKETSSEIPDTRETEIKKEVSVKKEMPEEKELAAENLLKVAVGSLPLASNEPEVLVKNEMVLPEEIVNSSVPAKDSSLKSDPKNKLLLNGFFYEVGAGYLMGWQSSGNRDANGISPVVGINYLNSFTNKIALSFGVQYFSVGNLSNSSRSSKVTSYRLGEESHVTTITPVKLHYINVPLKLNYRLDDKNTFGLGYNIAYLLNVDAKVEEYDKRLNGIENQTVTRTNGYTEGFQWYDSQVSVFYRRKLYKNFSVGAEVFIGLTEVKDYGFFKSEGSSRNSGLKLTLVYNVFK